MNFFEHQEEARRKTHWLVFLFIIAVIVLISVTDLFVIFSYAYITEDTNFKLSNIPQEVHLTVAAVISAIVFVASLSRIYEMSGGGKTVASALGGRLLNPLTEDEKELRLLNIVEEMAIASGTPVPEVYILEDSAINAFAAGYSIHDAVVGVTRGTIDLLNRDELQGVVAHEFSHIFNGDMRLNMRLSGFLFGILFLGLIGQKIARHTGYSRKGGQLALFGVGLMAIGYGGSFFGGLIKSTVSRQREYLADASAVQYTRNPEGIGGALKKIGGWVSGSHISSPDAAEYSHFYIANGVGASFANIFSTHPPLHDRIKKIQPHWDGKYPKVKRESVYTKEQTQQNQNKPFSTDSFRTPDSLITAAVLISAISQTGMPTSDHMRYAQQLIKAIPASLLIAGREPITACALVFGLMMDKSLLRNMAQQDKLLKGMDREIYKQFRNLVSELLPLDIKYRLPLIELAIPTLKRLSEDQYEEFNDCLLRIVQYDNRIDFWEWALYRIISLSLNKPELAKEMYDDFNKLEFESAVLLSAMIYSSEQDNDMGKQAYAKASAELGISYNMLDREEISNKSLLQGIRKMNHLKPLVKPKLLKALALAAQHDSKLQVEEIEFIRAISVAIDCPMPPLLDLTIDN